MVFVIDWSKTDQHNEFLQTPPLVANKHSNICPVRWILYMTERISARPEQNLFCFFNGKKTVPITYRDLMVQMRLWLELIGKDSTRYSTHSLRRGAASRCHRKNFSERLIQEMGAWRSDCYKRYIDIDMESRVRASVKFSEQD